MKKIQILAATAATVFTAGTVVSTTTQVASAASKKTVTVGVVGDSDRQLWEYVVKDAKKKYASRLS